MAESTPSKQSTQDKQFAIQKIYIKDCSFESPNTPQAFTEKWSPDVNMQINNAAMMLNEGAHQVTLTITVNVKNGDDKTAYLVEVQQAGIFNIQGYGKEDLAAMLGSYCPSILFPYAREAISDVVVKGGFPQLLIAPVNFEALYAQYRQQRDQQGMDASKH